MVDSHVSEAGLVFALSHDEVQYAVESQQWIGGTIGGLVSLEAGPFAGATTGAAVTEYFTLQRMHIVSKDRGQGICLRIPWPALLNGQYYLFAVSSVLPMTPSGWGEADDGKITDDELDVIQFRVEHDAVQVDAVEFVLTTEVNLWRKFLILDDGIGGRWGLVTDMDKRRDSNGLYVWQLPTGKLTFWKWKAESMLAMPKMTPKIELPIAHLKGRDRVTFTWLKD